MAIAGDLGISPRHDIALALNSWVSRLTTDQMIAYNAAISKGVTGDFRGAVGRGPRLRALRAGARAQPRGDLSPSAWPTRTSCASFQICSRRYAKLRHQS